jgi:5-methylcytosine-specific restriction endonuclease McrA
MNLVFVLDANKTPLLPCHPMRARKLLELGKASVYKRYPFTIILKRVVENPVDPNLEIKVDPGSKTTGIAVVNPHTKRVVFAGNLHHRGERIVSDLLKRSQVRRGRRNRKTRYRKPRFDNRKKEEGWLPPSLLSRVNNVVVWTQRLMKYCPIGVIHVETAKFDTQLMQNPEISGIEYQQGTLQGYEVKEYLLEKFDYKCAYCGIQNVPLEVEHVWAKSKGGSDRVSNLVISCVKCNDEKTNMPIEEFLKDRPELLKKIQSQMKASLKDSAVMNAIRYRIGDELKKLGLPVCFWTGGRTKYNRHKQGYPKEHWIDAACIGEGGDDVLLDPNMQILIIEAIGRGNRQMCLMDKYGFPRTKPKQSKRVHGFQTGDMVRLVQPSGKYAGTYVGKVVVRARGDFDIITKERQKITATWKRFTLLQRFDGYSYTFSPA